MDGSAVARVTISPSRSATCRALLRVGAVAVAVVVAATAGTLLRDARQAPRTSHDADAPSHSFALSAGTPAADPFEGVALPDVAGSTRGLRVERLSTTLVRAISDEGGWSLDIPAGWHTRAGPLRGGGITSFVPGVRADGVVLPAGGVQLSVRLWPDPDRRGPVWYADNEDRAYPGSARARSQATLAGIAAEVTLMHHNEPHPTDLTYVSWWLRHPSFTDRVLRIDAAPGNDPAAREIAERIASSLRVSAPRSGPRSLLSRDEALRASAEPASRLATTDRADAKLALVKEVAAAGGPGAGHALDPDTPVWVVAQWGEFRVRAVGPLVKPGRTRAASAAPAQWRATIADARTGATSIGLTAAAEPEWWSRLRDRAR